MSFAASSSRHAWRVAVAVLLLLAPGCGEDDPTRPRTYDSVTYSWQVTRDLPTIYDLNALHVLGPNHFVAVGDFGLIVEYGGQSWIEHTTNTSRDLWSVWAAPTGEMYAVGDGGVALERTQFGWVNMESTTPENLRAVWGVAWDDVYAVGDAGVVLHYDGAAWAPMESMSMQPLFSVWGSGSNDVFAVGLEGTILHFQDGGWGPMNSGIDETLAGVCGAASDMVVAVGGNGAALRYDANSWQPIATGLADQLQAVWVAARDLAFAVGANGTILRYNGIDWTPVDTPTGAWLLGIGGWSADDITAVGSGMLVHYDGNGWRALTKGAVPQLRAVWADGTSRAIAVGYEGSIMRFTPTGWNRMGSPTTRQLNSVWGSSETEAFAVGDNGRLLRFDGSEWVPLRELGPDYYGIWGDGDDTWVVGEDGLVLYSTDGIEWGTEPSATRQTLRGVWGPEAELVIAVGNNGEIIERKEGAWARVTSPVSGVTLFDVCGRQENRVGPLHAFAVGDAGTILERIAATSEWYVNEIEFDGPLYAVCVGPYEKMYAAGAGGTILKLTVNGWAEEPSPTTEDLLGFSRTSDGELLAVGGADVLSGVAIILAAE